MQYATKQWVVRLAVALSIGLGAWTSGAAQSLTWLGTLGGGFSQAWGFLPTAMWWSDGHKTLSICSAPFAGHKQVGW